jgi:hypothetical protein
MYSACTAEIDDVDAATEEIFGQLHIGDLLKNSVGLISCYSEFVDAGIVEAIARRLPFDVVGCSTMGNATRGRAGIELLSLSVLTSDDVCFSSVISGPVGEGAVEREVGVAYEEALKHLPGEPSLILVFMPVLKDVPGETLLETLDSACGGKPIFGTFFCDEKQAFENCYTIKNEVASRRSMALVLMHGNIKPRFFMTAMSDARVLKQNATITGVDGFVLKSVNDMPLLQYLETLGVSSEIFKEYASLAPFMVDYGDGTTRIALGVYGILPNGDALFGAKLPKGGTIAMASRDYSDIIDTSASTIRNALETDDINALIMFPCFSRAIMLGPNAEAEVENVIDIIGGKFPYHIGYSGGEICPVYTPDGRTVNRFHNFTFTVCVL